MSSSDLSPARASEASSFTARTLVALATLCHRAPWLVLLAALATLTISLVFSFYHLEFQTDRGALISEKDELYSIQERFLTEFPESDDVVVTVSGADSSLRETYVDELAERLRAKPEYYHDVFPRLEFPFLRERALYYLEVDQLDGLLESLEEARPLLLALSGSGDLSGLLKGFGQTAKGSEGLGPVLPFLNGVLEQLLISLRTRGRFEYQSPFGALFFGGESETEVPSELREPGKWVFYNTLNGGTHLLLLRPNKAQPDVIPRLREEVLAAARPYPELRVGITGEAVLEYDEMISSEQDSKESAIHSLLLVGLLFGIAFRSVLRPLFAIAALVVGVGWTVGFTTVAVGHLNLLTVSFATILIGLGIDFGIHFLFRYEEEFVRQQGTLPAMQATMVGTGVENFVGALSTAIAFWAVGLTRFKGVAEIGIIAGTGVMLCFLSMATVLISFIFLRDRHRQAEPEVPEFQVLPALEKRWLRRSPLLLTAAFGLTAWCLLQLPFAHFDYNLLRLQDPSLASVQSELELINSNGRTVLFAVSLVDSVEEAMDLALRYQDLASVERAESVGPLFPEKVEEKSERIARLQKLLKDVNLSNTGTRLTQGADLAGMADSFLELDRAFRQAYPSLINQGDDETRRQALAFKGLLERLFATLESMGPGPIEDGVSGFSDQFFSDLSRMVDFLKSQKVGPRLRLEELPENLRVRSLGVTDKLVVRVYPKANIWEREALERFVADIRKVDPEVIGAPVMILHHTTMLKEAFEVSGVYALTAVCVILLVHFRSLRLAFLALLPLALGVSWMLGAMKHYDIWFNPANFMGLPLILGIGLDFGIHVVHRAMEEGRPAMFTHSTGPATALSALTTMAGFGTLAMAGHQGIASLGFVLFVGVVSIMINALVVLPAVLSATGWLSKVEH